MIKKVVFFSDVKDPTKDASSTQIMVRNIITGFKSLNVKIYFVAIVEKKCDRKNISSYYSPFVDDIFFVERLTPTYGRPIKKMFFSLFSLFHSSISIGGIKDVLDEECCLVSHSPAIDSCLYAKKIKEKYPKIPFIEYWSDPTTLGLKTIEEYNIKRCIFRYIEKTVLSYCDNIVYGTKSLYDAEKKFFPQYQNKMGYCDVCYNPDSCSNSPKGNSFFGYLGNYYSNIRNILPLYNAFNSFRLGNLLVCGSSDFKLENTEFVSVQKRIPQNEISLLEKKVDIEICILNKVGFQIPGKVFYETNTNKKILVILDGPVKKEIYDYLVQFKRFIFCENNEKSILETLKEIYSGKYDKIDYSLVYKLSPSHICDSILKGGMK